MKHTQAVVIAALVSCGILFISCGIQASNREAASGVLNQGNSGAGAAVQAFQTKAEPIDSSQFKFLFHDQPGTADSRVLDKFSVIELIQKERFYRDNALWSAMQTCYAPESTVTISWFHGNGKDFVTASSKLPGFSPHKIYDTLVWLNNTKAVAITLATIQLRTEIGGQPAELESDVKLLYRLSKTNAGWQIVALDAIYEKDRLIPLNASIGSAVPVQTLSAFRRSYANLAYVLSLQGMQVNAKLPGIDRPETISPLYHLADAWLSGT